MTLPKHSLGQIAYDQFVMQATVLKLKNVPLWAALDPGQQAGWEVIARAVVTAYEADRITFIKTN